MSDQVNQTATGSGNPVDDILTNDLTNQDTRTVLLPKGRFRFKVKKVEVKETEKPGEGKKRKVNIQLALNQDAASAEGQPIMAGQSFFTFIAITPTADYSADDIKKNLKKFQNAFGVTGAFYPVEQYEGREIEAEVTISPAKGEYQESNRYRWVNVATGKAE